MNLYTEIIRKEREYADALKEFSLQLKAKNPHLCRMHGLCTGARTAFIAAFIADAKRLCCDTPALLIVQDEKEAARACSAMRELDLDAVVYPYRDFIMHNIIASHDYEHERLNVLYRIITGSADVVIATADSALQYTMPQEVLSGSVMKIDMNTRIDIDRIAEFLVGCGYVRTDMVDGAGQFSIRGGIVDIFTASDDLPIRIELFDDEIDSMGRFDIVTQRRTESIDSFVITPAREVIVSAEAKERLISKIESRISKINDKDATGRLKADLEALKTGSELKAADRYIAGIYEQKECLLDYFPSSACVLISEYASVIEKLKVREQRQREDVSRLLEDKATIPSYAEFGKWQSDFEYFAETHAGVMADTFASGVVNIKTGGIFSIPTRQTVSYNDKLELLVDDMNEYKKTGYSVVLLCDNEIMAKNMRNLLEQNGIMSVVTKGESPVSPNMPLIMFGVQLSGYELQNTKTAVLSLCAYSTGHSAVQQRRKSKISKRTAKERIMSFSYI